MLKESLPIMVPSKSLDYLEVITALLCDVQTLHSDVFTSSHLARTIKKVRERVSAEGIGFLTKALPRLGKRLDQALSESKPLNAEECGFKTIPNSKLPLLLGELFQRVLDHNGTVLAAADVACVKSLRQVLYLFYKLELPPDPKLDADVIQKFVKTEEDVSNYSSLFASIAKDIDDNGVSAYERVTPDRLSRTIRNARLYLSRLFQAFDPMDIYPRHGPGAVSTKEQYQSKYVWTSIPSRLSRMYPLDAYFYASMGHFCDSLQAVQGLNEGELSARVCLVPKDSRGRRLISCEPLAFQWIQQGLGRAITNHVERHRLTRDSVRFTDQQPNQYAALQGSLTGGYATLDLNEASDRVSCGLVRLLFPEPVLSALMASRSLGTELPGGQVISLTKYAPMGSALCFPVLALTVWALLRAGLEVFDADKFNPELVYVYGDDVIVPTANAENAIIILESFGLRMNRDKSCTKGFFRESCGMDAFRGISVTPVRFRTPWSSLHCPDVFESYLAYANAMYDRQYYRCRNLILERLDAIYGALPFEEFVLNEPHVNGYIPEGCKVPRRRRNPNLQKVEYYVFESVPKSINDGRDGWHMLLRFFAEACSSYENTRPEVDPEKVTHGSGWIDQTSEEECARARFGFYEPFSVREYTMRRRNKLRRCWR
jgi:hypothetical protein